MKYLTCTILIVLGICLVWLSQNEPKSQNRIKTDLDRKLSGPLKLHNHVNKFEMMILGIVSVAVGMLFLLSELGLISIIIKE